MGNLVQLPNVTAQSVVEEYKKTIRDDKEWEGRDFGPAVWHFRQYLEDRGVDPSDPKALQNNPQILDPIRDLVKKEGSNTLKAVMLAYESTIGSDPQKSFWETQEAAMEVYKANGGPVTIFGSDNSYKDTMSFKQLRQFGDYIVKNAEKAAGKNGVIDVMKLGDADREAVIALTTGETISHLFDPNNVKDKHRITVKELKRGIEMAFDSFKAVDREKPKFNILRPNELTDRIFGGDWRNNKVSLDEAWDIDLTSEKLEGKDPRSFYFVASQWQTAKDAKHPWDGTKLTFQFGNQRLD